MDQGKSAATTGIQKMWTRRYPPITVALLSAVLIAVIVLPSALNIPQTNPTTIAEYAPVPPEDDAPPDTTGNISALGLGSSSSLQRGVPVGGSDLPSPEGRRRINKRCVGKPARQTEDPMSPPCVPFFDGNNGGATWIGVTKDEIRIVIPSQNGGAARCAGTICSKGTTPQGQLCDLDKPPNTDPNCRSPQDTEDHWEVRGTRAILRHFNLRYQTYDRRVHIWIHWGGGGNAASQRALAADLYSRIKPFAVPLQGVFSEAMAARKVMSFGGTGIGFDPASSFTRYSPYLWSFNPDIEHRVEAYAGYVCSKIAGRPVTHTDGLHIDGSPMKNTPRRYAFMYTSDAAWPGHHAFKDQVRPKLKECGIEPAVEVQFPVAGAIASPRTDGTYAVTNVAAMQDARVTTVLWFGGIETYTGQQADRQRFYPEIVIASDGHLDGLLGADFQNQNWFRHAWGPTPLLFAGNLLEEHPAYQACREGDPNAPHDVCAFAAIGNYRTLFMAFKAIQSAGPRLTPASIDRGLHSIPRIASTHPMLAACFFDPGDFTCVKDSVEQWWDPDALSPYFQTTGCFRMSNGGTRYLTGDWPEKEYAFQNTQDPCGSWLGGATIN